MIVDTKNNNSKISLAHVRYIKILTRLRGLRVKIASISRLHCLAIPVRDLSTKKTKPNVEKLPESLGVMYEFLIYRTWAFVTLTQAAISCESCLTTAIKVSSGIYTNCMLMAIMAAVDAFIDIWMTQGAKQQKKMNFSLKKIKSYSYHCADQWPFRVNNVLQSLLLKSLTCLSTVVVKLHFGASHGG